MTQTILTSSQRIAAVLRQRGIERTPEQVAAYIAWCFEKYRVAYPLAVAEVFADVLASGMETDAETPNEWAAVYFEGEA